MFPWLNARQSTVYKYGSLYLQRGMDVLTMKVTPMQIIRPMQTKKIVGELLDLLQLLVEMDRKKQSNTDLDQLVANPGSTTTDDAAGSASDAKAETLVEHPSNAITFRTDDEWTTVDLGPSRERSGSDVSRDNSIGKDRRVMGQIIQEGANNNRRKSSVESLTGSSGSTSTDIRSRIVGIVMDSPTPFENILEGIPNSISDNSFIKASIRTLFSTYMRAFHRSVTVHYIQGAHAAESNQAGHPTLMLYSSADNIVSSAKLDEVVADWKKRGHFVRCRKWEDTPHVGHFRLHPNEYTKEVQEFIEHLRLTEAKL
nr:hypothetical protein BaRGS_018498 [Batillaria attramentaria]